MGPHGVDVDVRFREPDAGEQVEGAVRQSVGERRAVARDEGGDCGDREAQPRARQRSRVGPGSAADVRGRAPRRRPRHGGDARHVGADLSHGRAGTAGGGARRLHRVHKRHAGDGERAGQGRSARRATFARSASITPSSRPISGRPAIHCRPTATRHIWRRCAGRGSRIRSSIGWQSKIRRGSLVFSRRSHETPAPRRVQSCRCCWSARRRARRRIRRCFSTPQLVRSCPHTPSAHHKVADENVERDPAVRRAVRLASPVDEVCLRRVEQRHAGRSSWRDGVPRRQSDGRALAARAAD